MLYSDSIKNAKFVPETNYKWKSARGIATTVTTLLPTPKSHSYEQNSIIDYRNANS